MQITYIQKHIYTHTSIHYTDEAFFFLVGNPHILLKSETSSYIYILQVRGSYLSLPINVFFGDQIYILIFAGV
jgi:cupin superfamily acireductone dioxygenase involved in methionine salvage